MSPGAAMNTKRLPVTSRQILFTCYACLTATAVLISPPASCRAQYDLPTTREALVQTLRHQEKLVKSAACEYDDIFSPTRPEMASLLKAFYKQRGQDKEAARMIISQDTAKKYSHHVKWWRKGQKERLEEYDPTVAHLLQATTTFNGQVHRILKRDKDITQGYIYSPERSAWLVTNRVHPFSFLFNFYETYFSDIVEKGEGFRLEKLKKDGQDYVVAHVRHPLDGRGNGHAYEMYFGKGGLLQERHLLVGPIKNGPQPWRTIEVARFSDYRRKDLPQGEPLWFPHQVTISYYAGQFEGKMLEWMTETVRIQDIRFNVDIPDEMFTIEFPENARVFDGLTGQETWLEPGVRPAAVFHPETYGRTRLWRIASASLVGLILFSVVIVFRRRRLRMGPVNP